MPGTQSPLSPLIEKLKAWRIAKNLSQSEAVRVLATAGLPIALTTLQQWEIGRRNPQSVTAAALERFLAQQEKSTLARAERAIAPVIARLMEWRRANGLSQAQAVGVLCAAGLPAKIKTLQAWEIGRNSPQSITAAALEQFLDQHPAPTRATSHRTPPPQS